MRAVMIMFDTLTRNYLSSYSENSCITPNFKRLEEKCCVMDRFYAGSLPCMPARRELHSGKYNFLHRSWGPLEPFDHSVIQMMSDSGIYTHLCTDHSHYFEDGGATYHNRYCTWEGFRGQEGDRWIPRDGFEVPGMSALNKEGISAYQHQANKTRLIREEDMSSVKTFYAGIDFINTHQDRDNWFLQIESFDPHEPFYVPQKYREMYDLPEKVHFNWPAYKKVEQEGYEDDIEQVRKEYAALLTMCDHYLGKILDTFDKYDMWKDTMIIVNTDHGFLLGEHGYMGKNIWPMHQEIAHIPFYIHIPETEAKRIHSLCQTIDIAPTLLQYFGLPIPENMEGKSLLPVIKENKDIHDYALFGTHGGQVNITDGDYVFMKSSKDDANCPYVECTLMPTHMRGYFEEDLLKNMTLHSGDSYSNGFPYLKMYGKTHMKPSEFGDSLWDVRENEVRITDNEIQQRLTDSMIAIMKEIEAPSEEFKRLGLTADDSYH